MTVCAGPSLPCPAGPVADLPAAIEVVRLELGSVGAAGDPRICASLLRASSAVDGLALGEVAAMDAYGTCHEAGQGSAAAVVQGATGYSVQAARGTVRLVERLDGDLRPLGDLLVAGRVSRRHCTAVVHGVRGLSAEVIATSLEAICTLALHTDPERLASELRTRAEAISPELAEQARRRLDARVGVSCDETPDGTVHLSGTLHPETLALFQAVTDAVVHVERVEGDTRSQVRRRHDALQKVLQHAADCAGLDLPAQGGTRAQINIVATAATVAGLAGAEPARLLGTRQGLLTRSELLRLLCDADVSTGPSQRRPRAPGPGPAHPHGHRGPVARSDGTRPRVRRPGLSPAALAVPGAPRPALGRRRSERSGEPGAAVPCPPPRRARPAALVDLQSRPDHDLGGLARP